MRSSFVVRIFSIYVTLIFGYLDGTNELISPFNMAPGLAAELSEFAHDVNTQALQDSVIVFTVHATSFFVVRIFFIYVTLISGYLDSNIRWNQRMEGSRFKAHATSIFEVCIESQFG